MVDSGASVSICDLQTIKHLEFKVTKGQHKITSISNHLLKIIGTSTIKFQFQQEGKQFVHTFYIMENKSDIDHQILLGSDFLENFKMTLDYRDHTISTPFEKGKINFKMIRNLDHIISSVFKSPTLDNEMITIPKIDFQNLRGKSQNGFNALLTAIKNLGHKIPTSEPQLGKQSHWTKGNTIEMKKKKWESIC